MYFASSLILTVAADAAAQCRTIEFAELNSLDRGALLDMRCEYHDAGFKAHMASIVNAAPNPMRSAADTALGTKCGEEVTRIDRLIAKKYGLPATNQTALALRINVMCESRGQAARK